MNGIDGDLNPYPMNNNYGNYHSSSMPNHFYERNHTNSADSLGTIMESDDSSKTE